jgi:hypothetical protein
MPPDARAAKSDQAASMRRRRADTPTRPKPASSIAQVAGSGTAPPPGVITSVAAKLSNSKATPSERGRRPVMTSPAPAMKLTRRLVAGWPWLPFDGGSAPPAMLKMVAPPAPRMLTKL